MKFVVHNLEPMNTKELAALRCGHCRHRLTMHATLNPGGLTRCAICHCLRSPGEDILQPHNFNKEN